jgi:SAM-dependent methyltransferase
MELKDLQRNWDELGKSDPLWAILTWPGMRGRRWEIDEFLATGVEETEALMQYLRSLGRKLSRESALDFGCGVGRMTQPLARHFSEVWGIDIAPSMIERASELNRHGDRCKYRVNGTGDLALFPDNTFDFVYSKLTLQHMPPPLAEGFIREFVRVLAPDGLLVFQMAGEITARRGHLSRTVRGAIRRLFPAPLIAASRKLRYGHLIDMHGIPRERVARLLEENGVTVLDIQEDTSAGGGWTSFRYCATKQ